MGKPRKRNLPDLSALASEGCEISVRVVPKASRNAIIAGDTVLKVLVTSPPENGKANAAVQSLLAMALGIAPSQLTLIRGATNRDKLFRVR